MHCFLQALICHRNTIDQSLENPAHVHVNSVYQALSWEEAGFEANSLLSQIVESPAGLSRVLLPMLMVSLELAWSGNLTAQGSDGDL